jgi:hypothetical protein
VSNFTKSKILKVDIGVFKDRMRQGDMDRKTQRETEYGQRQRGRHRLRARRGGNRAGKPREERHVNRSEIEGEKSECGRHVHVDRY